MKNLTNMMIAAAALVVTAGMAKAQVIKAEVPFSFRAGGKLMPAGEYRVVQSQSAGGARIIGLANFDAHVSVLTAPYQIDSAASDPKLTFECSGANCALVKMATGSGPTYGFSRPNWGKGEDTRVAVIRAVLVK